MSKPSVNWIRAQRVAHNFIVVSQKKVQLKKLTNLNYLSFCYALISYKMRYQKVAYSKLEGTLC